MRPAVVAAAAAAACAYGWWVAGLRPFTWGSTLAVEGAGVAAAAFGALRLPSRSAPAAPPHRPGLAAWATLALALAAWQLASWLQHPRDEHPTLSSLADAALDWRPLRAAAFAAWVAGAAAAGRRRSRA